MSYRKRDNLVAPNPIHITYYYADCAAVVSEQTDSPTVRCIGTFKDITDDSVGGFRPGVYRVNPVTIRKGKGSCSSGHVKGCHSYFGSNEFSGQYNYFRYSMPYGTWDLNLATASLNRANAALQGATAECGVALAELGKTLQFLKQPFGAVCELLWGKRYQSIHGFLTFTAQMWLEYRYSLRPLMKDIADIIKSASNEAQVASNALRSCRKGASTNSKNTVNGGYTGYSTCSYAVLETTERKVSSTTIIYYRLNSASGLKKWGLHPLQLPSIAWELVPFSFVVDWFLSVGDFLKAIVPNFDVTILGACTSQKSVITYKSEPISPYWGSPGNTPKVFDPSVYEWTSETLIRQIVSATSVKPAFNPRSLGVSQILDSLALSWGRVNFSNIRR